MREPNRCASFVDESERLRNVDRRAHRLDRLVEHARQALRCGVCASDRSCREHADHWRPSSVEALAPQRVDVRRLVIDQSGDCTVDVEVVCALHLVSTAAINSCTNNGFPSVASHTPATSPGSARPRSRLSKAWTSSGSSPLSDSTRPAGSLRVCRASRSAAAEPSRRVVNTSAIGVAPRRAAWLRLPRRCRSRLVVPSSAQCTSSTMTMTGCRFASAVERACARREQTQPVGVDISRRLKGRRHGRGAHEVIDGHDGRECSEHGQERHTTVFHTRFRQHASSGRSRTVRQPERHGRLPDASHALDHDDPGPPGEYVVEP